LKSYCKFQSVLVRVNEVTEAATLNESFEQSHLSGCECGPACRADR
jgi:hypothetical protein